MYKDTSAQDCAPRIPPVPYAPDGPRAINGRTAVDRNVADGRPFSIYLREQGRVIDGRAESYELTMPDEKGRLGDEVLRRRTGIVVSWPTNPHNSGEAAILDRLNDSEAQKVFQAPVCCVGFAADQCGRHHRIS